MDQPANSNVEPRQFGPPSATANPFRWALIGDWLTKGSAALLLIALTHWLSPSAVGIALLASSVTLLGQTLADAGLSRALVQGAGDPTEHCNVVFWINLALAVLLCLGLVALAPRIAAYFHAPEATTAMRVQSLGILLNAASGVHLALLNRQLHFRPLAAIRAIAALTPVLVAIPMAIAGFSYWSLVCAALAGSAAQTLAAIRFVHWRPSLQLRLSGTSRLLRYGFWITLEIVLGWSLFWLDSLLVGGALGLAALGIYRTGSQIALLTYALVLGPMLPVYFAKFSLMHGRGQRLGQISTVANEGFCMAGIGLALLLCFGAPIGVSLTMPTDWQDTTRVIVWVGLSLLLGWSVAANAEALRAQGQVRYTTALIVLSIAIYALLLPLAADRGLEAAAQARCLASLLLIPIHWVAGSRLLGLRLRDQLRPLVLPLCSGLLALVSGMQVQWLSNSLHLPVLVSDLLATLTALTVYVLLILRRARAWLNLKPLARPVPVPASSLV